MPIIMKIRSKDLEFILGTSDKTARNLTKEIKKKYGIRIITIFHVSEYLNLHPVHILQIIALKRKSFDVRRLDMLAKQKIPDIPRTVKSGKKR